MFGNLVHRLQTLSPLTSPITSPVSSPKVARKRYSKSPAHRRSLKEEYREVQSDPEDIGESKKCRAKRKAEKRQGRKPHISGPLPGSKSLGKLDGLKEIQRLAEYVQYFESVQRETDPDHADHDHLQHASNRAKQAVKRGQEESDLERIQDLFPNDCLRLYDKDVVTMKMKGLMRKRSSTAARLQRALSAKSLRPESPPPAPRPLAPAEKRTFIMEAPVQFVAGVQSQERHLFLFNDLLLVAKARAGGNFKLKEKVRVSELWMSRSSLDEVTELNKSADTSFVLGWPTTNVVATFTTQAARDLWWNTLQDVLNKERDKEPRSTNIQVTYYDLSTAIEYCKTFSVGPDETARDCIRLALEHLEMRGLDASQFQLWAKTAREESPYPLVGHERPFAIKLSCLRDGLSSEEGFDLDHCNNLHDPLARCHFILRSTAKSCDGEVKKSCKKAGGRMRIGHVFRRSLSKESSGCLFGLPLTKICEGDSLPRPVMSMLQQLLAKGPFTQGIFRKSANARMVRELRDKLDAGEAVTWDHVPVLVTAALFKDFLRSLPDPLLCSSLYPQWRDAIDTSNTHHKLLKIKGILAQLPKVNHSLLCHFLCVLHHISRRAPHNLMSTSNLGVCVGPSLLWSDAMCVTEDLRAVPVLVECLVSHCQVLCGSHVPHLLGDPRDSGTEESDSMRRDDSSIDSLECSPPPRKDKISLSRDSGLTMSDSQLYTPDEEESGSTSSSGYDPAFDNHAKVTSTMSGPAEYVRVYGGWEERLNPNFQRQAWFRQRSRRLSSVPNNSKTEEAVRRSASEESLLDTPPPPTPPRRNKPDMNGNRTEVTGKSSPKEPMMYADDKFGRHPPLRKVTAVHCEVVDQTPRSRYKDPHSPIYGVNGVKKLSLSSAELNFSPSKSEQSFVSRDGNYSPQRIQEIYSPIKSDQSFNRIEHSYSSSSLLNHSNTSRSSDSNTISDHSTYSSPKVGDKVVLGFGSGDYYYALKENEEVHNSECDDSSTLSDDDCTPHVSRSNSRGNEVTTKLRHLPPVHVETCFVRGRLKRKEERAAHRSRSLPPPPPYRPPPPATPATQNRRAPITSYYLGDCSQSQRYIVTRTFMDEESYV
ncbi:rho GTPase-activating protein 20-like isoform X2 [Macrosteles quadrilineatus]|uniref:rho GTPase-activating protein 20-like isoform X2 n=1 Tax=Macrosteles quadrilineatus TaxID=74068 RepID=UPI0023E19F35|nr:rho GTPase-activating protein 20-like isoform X2 [Macrosteles quadrilineatus]